MRLKCDFCLFTFCLISMNMPQLEVTGLSVDSWTAVKPALMVIFNIKHTVSYDLAVLHVQKHYG